MLKTIQKKTILIALLTMMGCGPQPKDESSVTYYSDGDQNTGQDNSGSSQPDFQKISNEVGATMDTHFVSNELLEVRSSDKAHLTDKCEPNLVNSKTFGEQIAYWVQLHLQQGPVHLSHVRTTFSLPFELSDVTLASHKMCRVNATSLSKTIGAGRVPAAATIEKINRFVDNYNALYMRNLEGDRETPKLLAKFWTKVMMCLSYTESLTTANTARAEEVASKYAPEGYEKPPGVLFYENPGASGDDRVSIGLYQFTPYSYGNVLPCIRAWNSVQRACPIKEDEAADEMTRILGSQLQSFNAFCGVNKLLQLFAVQVNTTATNRTHPMNLVSGKLTTENNRCVSLNFSDSNAYNHFGPFQNSTGSNLDQLMDCALK